MDFKTTAERNREAARKRICAEYVELQRTNPDVSRNRIINKVAENNGRTAQNIKDILVAAALYVKAARGGRTNYGFINN